ncbi:DNA polymerase III subunit delta' [Cytophagaceae bacterium ABcell3]|nr:DNA polymerase III subunit delta' [Cytophagaceae bacterium ABcell3]
MSGIKKTLISSVQNNHIAHAQLFAGQNGSASLALALAYATYINCENKTEHDACGQCPSCLKINKLIHPDLHFIFPVNTTKTVTKDATCTTFMKDWRQFLLENPYNTLSGWGQHIGAENKQLNISADEARNIIKTVSLKAYEGEYKIMIMWMAEQMNVTAANAILKILEEPPEKTVFLLISGDLEKILPTILSRAQVFRIPPFSDQEISSHLVNELNIEQNKAEQVAYLADGNLNEALKLLSDLNEDNLGQVSNWLRSCYKKDFAELISRAESFHKLNKDSQKGFFQYSLNIIRESLVCKYASEDFLRLKEEDLNFIVNFSKILDHHKIDKLNKEFNEASFHLERNASPKIVFLDVSLSVSSILHGN